ncbi:hypothetical protein Maq22A_c14295 [Methylobacterium aquaticum]|uniref:Uncharacterized protein n=1 Tax=Methylobacterium aquaticum TaxID=270351 RepID=A0A0C6F0D3_9HYPH|nr:hypothetical protein Maq22A_c14295 [Methylobacterium aquaticum]
MFGRFPRKAPGKPRLASASAANDCVGRVGAAVGGGPVADVDLAVHSVGGCDAMVLVPTPSSSVAGRMVGLVSEACGDEEVALIVVPDTEAVLTRLGRLQLGHLGPELIGAPAIAGSEMKCSPVWGELQVVGYGRGGMLAEVAWSDVPSFRHLAGRGWARFRRRAASGGRGTARTAPG